MNNGKRILFRARGASLGPAMAVAAFRPQVMQSLREQFSKFESLDPQAIADNEDAWSAVTQVAGVDRQYINLRCNWAGVPSVIAEDAVAQYFLAVNNYPADYATARSKGLFSQRLALLRNRLATHFNCAPQEIALTRNTTEALVNVIFGLQLEAGDEILLTDQDYPTFLGALLQRSSRDGIRLTRFKLPTPAASPQELLDAFTAAISPRTRAILLCHLYVSGQVTPVREICEIAHQRNIAVIVDGALAMGNLNVDLKALDCDYYGASFYKFAYGPSGTGFLYVRRDRIRSLWPLYGSYDFLNDRAAFDCDDIRKFEGYGTVPDNMLNGLFEMLEFREAVGRQRWAARVEFLKRYWTTKLQNVKGIRFTSPLSGDHSSPLVLFEVENVPVHRVEQLLLEKQILVGTVMVRALFNSPPARYLPNRLWIDAGIFNRTSELDAAVAALGEIASAHAAN